MQVHQGFQEAYSSVASGVVNAVKRQLSTHSGYTLTVAGHSLGAGIAAIATSSLISQGLPVTSTYTFGEPRNGDAAWAKYIEGQISNSNYYRVTHANDGVPQIPPTILNYIHHGTEYWEGGNSTNDATTTYNCGSNSTVRAPISHPVAPLLIFSADV
jgi:predicted lipase